MGLRKKTRPIYTKTSFVRGFSLRLCDFYRLREATAVFVLKKGLQEANLGKTDAKWDIESQVAELKDTLEERATKYKLVVPPAYWKHSMLRGFVSKTAQWAKKHVLKLAEGKIIKLPRIGTVWMEILWKIDIRETVAGMPIIFMYEGKSECYEAFFHDQTNRSSAELESNRLQYQIRSV